MTDEPEVTALLDRFIGGIGGILPLVAVWAHGSLALGDFQLGRSDFDLVALVGAEIDAARRQRIGELHENLIAEQPLAAKLHCTYVTVGRFDDPDRQHVTFAQEELFDRTVSVVSRRELAGGRTLFGPPPTGIVPLVTDAELAGFIRTDLRDFWYPATGKAANWLQDIWVDLGPVTLARATVTLRDGRLITKREALDILPTMGAPLAVVDDIRAGRYGIRETLPLWRQERGTLARSFMRSGIERVLDMPAPD